MSLFDDASLVLTPNGYKASKLYSIKPTSGLGDMVVSRGTTATRVNSAGLIESVAINVPRLDYPPLGGCPRILVEPQRKNELFESQDISSALWVKTNAPTITTNIAVAPDGTTTANGIQSPNAAASFKTISQAIVVTANSTVTASVFVKKETSETNFGGLQVIFTGVTTKVFRVIVNAVAGTAVISSDSTLTGTTKVEDYGTYWRISATTTDNGSNIGLTFLYYGTLSTNGTSTGTGIGSVRTVWGFQLEIAANFTSYIPTTTAQITRNADVISKTGVSSLIGQPNGTIFVEANLTANTEQRRIITIGTELQRIMFWTLGTTLYVNFNGVGIAIGAFPIGTAKMALGYTIGASSTTYSIKVNNNTLITGTAAAAPSSLSAIYLGSTVSGTLILNDRIESATLFLTRLTDPQLATLTAI
jgi:hypothetical protein